MSNLQSKFTQYGKNKKNMSHQQKNQSIKTYLEITGTT
jgi:hypothetical protein